MMMVSILFLLFAVGSSSLANGYAISSIGASEYADTEVSTNIPIVSLTGSRNFDVDLAIEATWTNCVELTMGCDMNNVSKAAAAFSIGWDSGTWKLSVPCKTNEIVIVPFDDETRKRLCMHLDIGDDDSVRKMAITDGNHNLIPDGIPFELHNASGWTMLRVTLRGSDSTLDALTVRTSKYGTELLLR